jgi:hypothetical protein
MLITGEDRWTHDNSRTFQWATRVAANELLPSRIDHWRAAVRIWRDFPLLGAGVGKYPLLKNRHLADTRGHVFWAVVALLVLDTRSHGFGVRTIRETAKDTGAAPTLVSCPDG